MSILSWKRRKVNDQSERQAAAKWKQLLLLMTYRGRSLKGKQWTFPNQQTTCERSNSVHFTDVCKNEGKGKKKGKKLIKLALNLSASTSTHPLTRHKTASVLKVVFSHHWLGLNLAPLSDKDFTTVSYAQAKRSRKLIINVLLYRVFPQRTQALHSLNRNK